MGIMNYILGGVLIVGAIVIIAIVLMQQGRRKGVSGVISGAADTFMSKGKAKAIDAVLAKWTKWIAIAFAVLVIAANVLAIYL